MKEHNREVAIFLRLPVEDQENLIAKVLRDERDLRDVVKEHAHLLKHVDELKHLNTSRIFAKI